MDNYILVTGAPGSRWSGYVEDHLYTRNDIDTSDRSPEREYWIHGDLMHRGAYFDPEMEFGNFKEDWDKPFSGTGTRIIKSHFFSCQLHLLKDYGYPMHIVMRTDEECFEWWHEAGGWDITYPSYKYYKDDETMKSLIAFQNYMMRKFVEREKLEKHSDGKRDYYIWTKENG